MDPLAEVLDYEETVLKEQRIAELREKQKNDVDQRHSERIRLKTDIDQLESLLDHHSMSSFEVACSLSDLDQKRDALRRQFFADGLADQYWSALFSSQENTLTHNERKLLRSFDKSTAIAENFSRNPTAVFMSKALFEAKQSPSKSMHLPFLPQRTIRATSLMTLGNGDEIPTVIESNVPLTKRSSFFSIPTNGSQGAAHAALFSPKAGTLSSKSGKSSSSIPPLTESLKERNREALQLVLRNHLREAENILSELLLICDSSRQAEKALTLCNLSIVKRQSHQLHEAELLLKEAIDIETSLFGEATISTVLNMSALLFTVNPNSDEALRLVEQVVEQLNSSASPLFQVSQAHLEHIRSVRSKEIL